MFAVEILLKIQVRLAGGIPSNGHNPRAIFRSLPVEWRDRICGAYQAAVNKSVDDERDLLFVAFSLGNKKEGGNQFERDTDNSQWGDVDWLLRRVKEGYTYWRYPEAEKMHLFPLSLIVMLSMELYGIAYIVRGFEQAPEWLDLHCPIF